MHSGEKLSVISNIGTLNHLTCHCNEQVFTFQFPHEMHHNRLGNLFKIRSARTTEQELVPPLIFFLMKNIKVLVGHTSEKITLFHLYQCLLHSRDVNYFYSYGGVKMRDLIYAPLTYICIHKNDTFVMVTHINHLHM